MMALVFVLMCVRVTVLVAVMMRMGMLVMFMMNMVVIIVQMNIEFHSRNSRFLLTRNVKMIAVEFQFFQLVLKLVRINAQIKQRSNKHIAADAAEDVEIESFHFMRQRSQTAATGQRIDLTRSESRAETIVNIHHSHAAGTTVQHPQQRREAAKAGAVTNAGRHSDHWF